MSKKLCTILLAALLAAPVLAQSSKGDKEGVVFAPQKGQWQVSLVLGHNGFYNENTSYLLCWFAGEVLRIRLLGY